VKPADAPAPTPTPTETAPQQPEAAKPEPRREEPARAQAESPAPKREAADKRAGEDRPSGIYLQLAATTEREADIEVDVLRKKGFHALAAEIPEKPGTFRVLVGPVSEGGVNKMKTDLQNAGFPGDKAIRRTM
jgi:cell division septation protein DedD